MNKSDKGVSTVQHNNLILGTDENRAPHLEQIPSDLIKENILPSLSIKDRVNLSSSSKILKNLDSEINKIHLLEEWKKLIEKESTRGNRKIILMLGLLYTLLIGGTAGGLAFSIKWAMSDTTCNNPKSGCWPDLLISLLIFTIFVCLCCAGYSINELYEPNARILSLRNNKLLSNVSNEVKNAAIQFNTLFQENPIDLNSHNLSDFYLKIGEQKSEVLFFMRHPEKVQQQAGEVSSDEESELAHLLNQP